MANLLLEGEGEDENGVPSSLLQNLLISVSSVYVSAQCYHTYRTPAVSRIK